MEVGFKGNKTYNTVGWRNGAVHLLKPPLGLMEEESGWENMDSAEETSFNGLKRKKKNGILTTANELTSLRVVFDEKEIRVFIYINIYIYIYRERERLNIYSARTPPLLTISLDFSPVSCSL